MAEATNRDSDNSSPVVPTEEKPTTTQKTFSQDEVDALIGKRLIKERTKTDEATKAAIAAAIAEHDKKARMTEEERFAEERKAKDDELAAREQSITLRENRTDAVEKLAELNIDTKLADFVVDLDRDKMQENIQRLNKAFNEAVAKSVEAKLAGKTPTDYGDGSKRPEPKKATASSDRRFFSRNGVTAF